MSPISFRRNLLEKPEQKDPSFVGITFVDVLFALVVNQILEPIAEDQAIPATGWAQLALAFIMTVTSWIGYHNSWNRPRFFIRFLNLPLAQFLVDVFLVIVYWATATWVEGLPRGGETPSAMPEAVLVAISFGLYLIWDLIGYRIRTSDRYFDRPLGRDVQARRAVTIWFSFGSVLTALVICLSAPHRSEVIITFDVWLVCLLIGFRIAKEAVTSPERRAIGSESAYPSRGDWY